MKLFRIVFNGLAIVSGTAALAFLYLWTSSYSVTRAGSYTDTHYRIIRIVLQGGDVSILCERPQSSMVLSEPEWSYQTVKSRLVSLPVTWTHLGFSIGRASYTGSGNTWLASELDMPIWPLLALLAVTPFLRLLFRPKKARPGHCDACGYDIRASTHVCPECGTLIKHPGP
jgi:hypothetical protein